MKFRMLVKELFLTFGRDFKQEWKMVLCFCLPLFVLLFFVNYHFLDIGYLQLHSVDEYFFHGSLLNIYNGFIHFEPAVFFRTGFYSYGFLFFLINWLFTWPFIALQNTSIALFVPKMVTVVFALFALMYIYKFSRLFVNKVIAVLLVIFIVLMPGFWSNAMWFHPDWMMSAWLLMAVYWLAKDNFNFTHGFWLSAIFFGLALSSKFQAFTFLPIFFLYIVSKETLWSGWVFFKKRMVTLVKFCAVFLSVYIICNPYLLHPLGLRVFLRSMADNLISNATNHGLAGKVLLSTKLSAAVSDPYINYMFLAIILAISFSHIYRYFKNKQQDLFGIVAIGFLINLVYLLLFVNKAWSWYYLPVVLLGILLAVPLLGKIKRQKLSVILLIVVLSVHLLINFGRLSQIFVFSYGQGVYEKNQKISDFIVESLNGKVISSSYIFISAFTGFEFDKLGLSYDNIHLINGLFSASMIDRESYLQKITGQYGNVNAEKSKPFIKPDFIVIRKDDVYFDEKYLAGVSDKTAYQNALSLINKIKTEGAFGCQNFVENELVYIFECN